MTDYISRQKVIDAMYELCDTDKNNPYRENPHIDAIQDKLLEIPSERAIDADEIIKKLDNRIDEFIKKHPDKKNSEPVVMLQELIQMIEEEVEDEE